MCLLGCDCTWDCNSGLTVIIGSLDLEYILHLLLYDFMVLFHIYSQSIFIVFKKNVTFCW